ncbi:hypothetical protein [Virgibacillus halodenitrificans]|uniref:hypothetical protein n=1 Tax=Virgibacillus halodenitrificans TaxID=1482 RepID=UPI00045C3D61|nr:hypothetical protein [Virgibacillus halodenitrificans]CDQ37109.1 hypothetical protein BN993_06642 [Virgibacillus halodenitrificans]
MKRSYIGVITLAIILFLDIVCMQLLVHQFFYENYGNVLLYMTIMIILFPVAFIIYKKEKHKGGGASGK